MQKWQKLFYWIQIDKQSLNIKKHDSCPSTDADILIMLRNVLINDSIVSETDGIKFLGIIVYQHLCWRAHTDYISKKVYKSIGIMKNIKKQLC